MAKYYKTLIELSNKRDALNRELNQLNVIDSPSKEQQAKIAGINISLYVINEDINQLNSLVE